jgi:hypothetical protein
VEMRRVVVTPIHRHHQSVEPANFWHGFVS